MSKIKGKQIDNATITQSNLNVTTESVVNLTDVTTKGWVEAYANSAVTSLTYATENLNMWASSTTANSGLQKACATAILVQPNSDVRVLINGVEVNIGTGLDCVFSPDGTTLRTPGSELVGDFLYWYTTGAKYQLESDDTIDFMYLIKKA